MTAAAEHTPECRITSSRTPDGPTLQTWPDPNCNHPKHTEAKYQ